MTTRSADVTGNRLLAARARDLGTRAPRGSLDRKAALCAAVALDETRSLRAARLVLDDLDQADVRDAARQLLDDLTTEAQQ
jgi:hypothetical protein